MQPKSNTLLSWLRAVAVRRRLPLAIRYAATFAAIALTGGLQLSLFGASAPWFLYTPAVVVIALFLGGGAGVLATALSAALAGYAVFRPDIVYLMTPAHWAATVFFSLTTVGLVGLVVALRHALLDADALRLEREAALIKTVERETFLSSVLAASTDCIKILNLAGEVTFMSEGGMSTMEVSDFNAIRGCPWPDFLKESGSAQAIEAITAARAGRTSHFESHAETYLGTPKFWSVSVSPIRNADGEVVDILSVSRDHTELFKAREQQRLLNGELSHRLKNILTLVQSIASQTLRNSSDLKEASTSFSARLAALGQAADVLTVASWEAATMPSIVSAGLAAAMDKRDRILTRGPAVRLNSQAALALTLAIHEMVTNATKYGALSCDTGAIMLDWGVGSGEEGLVFRFDWRERGGPPVSPPSKQGFGSRMIERSLQAYFDGTAKLKYEASGVELHLRAPLASIGEMAEFAQ